MKLFCKGKYSNAPAGLHFERAGVIEIDDPKGEYLLRDAPENFTLELPLAVQSIKEMLGANHKKSSKPSGKTKSLDEPTADKQIKQPVKKK